MEEAKFREKIDAMMPDLVQGIRNECTHLYKSGAVDTAAYEDNYLLPKLILAVAIENQVQQYTPLSPVGGKEMITHQAVKEYNEPGHPRRDEILYHFNFHINYREGQPKAIRIKEVTNKGVIFQLDTGEEQYREWF